MSSHVEIYGSSFTNCLSGNGVLQASDGTKLLVDGCTFETLVATDYSALLFAIQNQYGRIIL
jgi:hypothetical protein